MKVKDPSDLFVPTYARTGSPIVKGRGVYVWDAAGKKYLDFGSGIAVNALGHAHPSVAKALSKQGKRPLHTSNLYFSDPQIKIAKLLVRHSFGDRVFLCNSGTEANEAAIKFARKWAIQQSPEKYHVLSFADGFHGRTYGALSATAQEKFHKDFGPMLEGFHYAPFNDIEKTRSILKKHQFAAVILEPIQGESGVNTATPEFLRFLREWTTKNKIALIFDEIQSGVGRTGTLWNYEQHGLTPDMMTTAKPLGGGLPLGAVICKEAFVINSIAPGDHGTTFGGNPLACALGCEVISTISKKSFLKEVRTSGSYLQHRLQVLMARNTRIKDVRGAGLFVGVELDHDPKIVVERCQKEGLLLIKAGNNTVRFLPPLIVGKKEIDTAVKIFSNVVKS